MTLDEIIARDRMTTKLMTAERKIAEFEEEILIYREFCYFLHGGTKKEIAQEIYGTKFGEFFLNRNRERPNTIAKHYQRKVAKENTLKKTEQKAADRKIKREAEKKEMEELIALGRQAKDQQQQTNTQDQDQD